MSTTKFLLALIAVVLLAGLTVNAQTNTTPVAPPLPTGPNVFQDVFQALKDLYPFTTNGSAMTMVGGGYNTAGHTVEGGMENLPVSSVASVGYAIFRVGSETYEAGVDLSFGVTNKWPLLGNMRTFGGAGTIWNFKKNNFGALTFTGLQKNYEVSKAIDLGFGLLVANISDQPGVNILGGLHATLRW